MRGSWLVASPDPLSVQRLGRELSVRPEIAACLVNRGLADPGAAQAFLDPRLASLCAPEGMADLERGAARVLQALEASERIGVFGDYDVDGISSAAIGTSFLRQRGASVEALVADRFAGYGLGARTVDELADRGCTLIVAFDCGTGDFEAARRARERGVDLVVVDHHRIEDAHPDVHAFVNPQRADCRFPDKTLCSAGLAFYFVAAVRRHMLAQGRGERSDLDLKPLLDLVALGTVADVVPLTGNNRVLVRHGLKVLSDGTRPGLRALIRAARIRAQRLRASHIAYHLAPRLNAAGRLTTAQEAFALLMSDNRQDADRLAERLNQLSLSRRTLEDEVVRSARAELALQDPDLPAVIVAGDGWHRGVLGIVAARLGDETGKPVFVVGFDGLEGIGSARGQGQVNLHETLCAVSAHLTRYGGHRDAAGFTVPKENLAGFRRAVIAHVRDHGAHLDPPPLVCDARLNASGLGSELLDQLEPLGPFGAGNPEPVFEIDGLYLLSRKPVGRDHLRLELKTTTGTISAFAPGLAAEADRLPGLLKVAATVGVDEWRGDGTPELRLVAPPVAGS